MIYSIHEDFLHVTLELKATVFTLTAQAKLWTYIFILICSLLLINIHITGLPSRIVLGDFVWPIDTFTENNGENLSLVTPLFFYLFN